MKLVGNVVILLNCSRMVGKLCIYFCIYGYFFIILDGVVCIFEGLWKMDNDMLCLCKIGIYLVLCYK